VPRLVACLLPGGDRFVEELRRVWDDGDALLPVDRRLPHASQVALIERMGAEVVVDEDGDRTVGVGWPVEPGDALVMATSGSTGDPKGVVLTHDAVAANARATSAYLEVDPERDCWLSCLPLAHVGGLSVVFRALLTGAPVVVHDGFEAGRVEEAARRGATLASFVPTAMARIDAGLFRRILVGGSAIPDDRPDNAVITYGMTETGSGVVYDRRPLEGVEIRIVDGEVQLRCPMLLRCYRDGTDPRLEGGWYPTGDAGAFEGGELSVFGRRGDMIISGGENVWPVAVERALEGLDGADALAVVGRPDPEWGEVVTLIVVPTVPDRPPSLAEARELVRERLAPYCAPRAIEVVDRLPTTALGKVQRHLL